MTDGEPRELWVRQGRQMNNNKHRSDRQKPDGRTHAYRQTYRQKKSETRILFKETRYS